MEMKKVKSSNIDKVGYGKNTKILQVQFRNGSSYMYADVPEEMHKKIVNSSSIGSSFHSNIIKGKFRCDKIK